MSFPGFEDAMRRVITGEGEDGKSRIIIDGGASSEPNISNLFEIWADRTSGPLDPRDHTDRGDPAPMLCPAPGGVKVRWFVAHPLSSAMPTEQLKPLVRAAFELIGAGDCVADQERHPIMHKTRSIDVICVLQGEAKMVLDDGEVHLKAGNVLIQRATAHAWEGVGGPALLLAVLIDRS